MPAISSRPIVALVTVLAVVILGGAFALSRSDQNVGPSTSPSPSPSATPYPSSLPLPSALVGGWLAPLRDSPIAQGPVSALQFGALDGNPTHPISRSVVPRAPRHPPTSASSARASSS